MPLGWTSAEWTVSCGRARGLGARPGARNQAVRGSGRRAGLGQGPAPRVRTGRRLDRLRPGLLPARSPRRRAAAGRSKPLRRQRHRDRRSQPARSAPSSATCSSSPPAHTGGAAHASTSGSPLSWAAGWAECTTSTCSTMPTSGKPCTASCTPPRVRGRTPRILQPCVPLQCRWCLPSAHGAPWWSKGTLRWPLGTFPPSGSMHRWFPPVVTGPPISVSKRPSSCKTWWAQLGSNQ